MGQLLLAALLGLLLLELVVEGVAGVGTGHVEAVPIERLATLGLDETSRAESSLHGNSETLRRGNVPEGVSHGETQTCSDLIVSMD